MHCADCVSKTYARTIGSDVLQRKVVARRTSSRENSEVLIGEERSRKLVESIRKRNLGHEKGVLAHEVQE